MEAQRSGNSKNNNRGFVTLISVLIVGAVGISITLSLLLIGIDSAKTNLTLKKSAQAFMLANACVESGLQHIRDNTDFTGDNTILFNEGSCQYTINSQGGESRTIIAAGTVQTTVRRIHVEVDALSPAMNIASWKEIPDDL